MQGSVLDLSFGGEVTSGLGHEFPRGVQGHDASRKFLEMNLC